MVLLHDVIAVLAVLVGIILLASLMSFGVEAPHDE